MMERIMIQNLRSLGNTGQIELKPINILAGGNGSGKSTFLRFFPLMKQSLGKRINGPILWSGDEDDYVDFGSFKEALNFNSEDEKIKFAFEIIVPLDSHRFGVRKRTTENNVTVYVKYYLKAKDANYDYVSQMDFEVFGRKIVIKLDENMRILSASVDKRIYEMVNKDTSDETFQNSERGTFDISLYNIIKYARKKIPEQLLIDLDEMEERESFIDINDVIEYYFRKEILKNTDSFPLKYKDIIEKNCKEEFVEKELFEDMLVLFKLSRVYQENITRYLNIYFRQVYYIAPVRATAERYYRLRNIAINEVDCRGKNLAVFLNSLSAPQFKKFQEWTNENLGFSIEKSPSEGFVSLKIKKKGASKAINLSDTGFGYSQILPIVTQLWYIAMRGKIHYREFENIPITFAVEQPELHLHPALQATLVDVIVNVMQESKNNIRFIIETHSETIVNRLGNLIYKEKLQKDQVGISIFNKEMGDDDTTIQVGNYDEEGYLENWPAGFFEPEEVQ